MFREDVMPAKTELGKFKVTPHVQFTIVDGQAVLLDNKKGIYLGLDDVGTRIWQQLAQGASLDQIASGLLQEFQVTEAVAVKDLEQFMSQLTQKGLVEAIPQDELG
jgi:hypothetical protein